MPSLVFNAPIIVEKAYKQPSIGAEIPLAKGGINPLNLPPKPALIRMPDIKLPQMPLPPAPL